MSDVLSNSSRRSLNFKPPHTLRSQKWDTSDQWILTRTKPLHLPPTTTTQEYQTHGESAYEGFLPTIMHAVSTAYMRQAISKQILNIEVTPLLMLLLFFFSGRSFFSRLSRCGKLFKFLCCWVLLRIPSLRLLAILLHMLVCSITLRI